METNFTLNSGGGGSGGGRSSTSRRMEARVARSIFNRRNITPQHITFDGNDHHHQRHHNDDDEDVTALQSPNKPDSFDDLSLYAGNSPKGSPRPCSISPCMDEMGGLLSPDTSPSHFTIITASNTTTTTESSGHLLHHHHSNASRRLLDNRQDSFEIDYNSADSGYGNSSTASIATATTATVTTAAFKFAEPSGVAPKRMDTNSPPKHIGSPAVASGSSSSSSASCFRVFNSLSSDSIDSMDDDYMELLDMDDMDEEVVHLPSHFNSIISGAIKSSPSTTTRRPALRRFASQNDANIAAMPRTPEFQKSTLAMATTPFSSRTSLSANMPDLQTTPEVCRAFKRPEAPSTGGSPSTAQSKRFKSESTMDVDKENEAVLVTVGRHVLRKSISMNDANIMSALARCKYIYIVFYNALEICLVNAAM